MSKIVSVITLFILFSTQIYGQQKGIILGDDVRVRAENTTKSKIVTQLDISTLVDVLIVDDEYKNVGSSTEICFRHKWVKIQTKDGKKGWVYGEFIQSFDMSKPIDEVEIKGKKYNFYLTTDMGYPTADEDLVGCTESRFPVLMPKGENKVHLLLDKTTYYEDNPPRYGYHANMTSYKNKYWVIESDDGTGQYLDSKPGVKSDDVWMFSMKSSGQDSYQALTVVELSIDYYGRLVAKGISYQDLTR
ncbi:MAG: SH3 domain-containing protein [Saprospiraceae bacterium]|nr:SH3 domain-containing protein [Saprospiraceae bacterium]